MQVIPLQPVATQSLAISLAGQPCKLNVYQRTLYEPGTLPEEWVPINYLFLDLYVNDVLVLGGVLCLNAVRIVRDAYFGFIGDLAFFDTQGEDDPVASGLGSRFELTYLEASDINVVSV